MSLERLMPDLVTDEPATNFTWRDLQTWEVYGSSMVGVDVERRSPSLPPMLRRRSAHPSVGGFLAWNKTLDLEGGTFIMLSGQDSEEERLTLRNVGWWVSCGLIYALSRVGRHYREPDHRVRSPEGHTWHVWVVPNNRSVEFS